MASKENKRYNENEGLDENKRLNIHVDWRMLPCKLMYILWGGVIGTTLPYFYVFFASVGITTSQAGVMTGIMLLASCIANPIWGFVSDYSGRQRLVVFLMCLGSMIFVLPMPWIAKALLYYPSNSTCVDNVTDSTLAHHICLSDQRANGALFNVLAVVLTLGAMFAIPLPGYLDTIAMDFVKASNTKATYGSQRIFGSIGCCIANFLSGLASDHYRHQGMSHYTPVFFMFLGYAVLLFPISYYLIGQGKLDRPNEAQMDQNSRRKNISKHLLKMIKDVDVIFFIITVVVSGIAMNTFTFFILLLIKDLTPSTKARMSLSLITATISSMIVFPFTSYLIKLVRGPTQGIMVAMFIYFVRYMIMSYTSSFWIMVGIQSLHGLCFALAWASMMEHVHKITPKEVNKTVFMMLASIHFAICGLIANTIGGKIYEVFGGRRLFRYIGILCGVWLIIMITYHTAKGLRKRRIRDNISNRTEGVGKCRANNDEKCNELGTENIATDMNEDGERGTVMEFTKERS